MSTMILGSIMALSSSNWVYVWMGLELNLLSFIPVMSSSSNLQETESAVKYFIVQTIGSGILMVTAMMVLNSSMFSLNQSVYTSIMCLSIMLKLGAAPTHWWLPHVMSGMSWMNCMILATWQKLAPIMLAMSSITCLNPITVVLFSTMSAIVGGMGGMNQTQLRTILAYSSIGHLGWMLMATISSLSISILYFSVYCAINISIMFLMNKTSQLKSVMNFSIMNMPNSSFMSLSFLLMSLGGLPPLLGFAPKWMVFMTTMDSLLLIPMLVLIVGSLMNLFYYLSMVFNFTLSQNKPWHSNTASSPLLSSILMTISGPLFLVVTM
uniref:NADH-ubiquinone oxidoreductase chain 2 n=1 Tax=Dendronereis chipolini TaxID=2860362 RepID=A0A8F7CFP3_9ANNE|nr:NADH dehydrogenase subunit 2 [Dendronereis chipolini]